MKKLLTLLLIGSMLFFSIFVNSVSATTIGTNISTGGTLTVQSSSATSVQFQDAGGTNTILTVNTNNFRVGINHGAALDTVFEVGGGTASASHLLTTGVLQVAGGASVAYSRFGTATTGHSNYISATNDILVTGDVEVDGSVSFAGTASLSGILRLADGQVRPHSNSTTAFRFQNAGGGSNALTIDTTNLRVGIGDYGNAIDTRLEVGGTASASNLLSRGGLQVAGGASVAYSRFGTSTTVHSNYISATNDILVSGDVEVRGTASFAGVASISGVLLLDSGLVRPYVNTTTALRFQNAGGAASILTIDSTNRRVGIGDIGVALDTVLEVGGTASASHILTTGGLQVAGGASVAYSRFGTGTAKQAFTSATNDLLITGDLEILSTGSFARGASISLGPLKVGTASNATTSITFDSIHASRGACLEIKDNDGSGFTYLRVANGVGTFSTVNCK